MAKFIILTENRNFSDEKFYLNTSEISEILPKAMVEQRDENKLCRSDHDDWNTVIVMSNGNIYKVLEESNRIIELIYIEAQ